MSKWDVRCRDVFEGQVSTSQVRIGKVRIGQVRTGQVRTGQDRTGVVNTGQVIFISNLNRQPKIHLRMEFDSGVGPTCLELIYFCTKK